MENMKEKSQISNKKEMRYLSEKKKNERKQANPMPQIPAVFAFLLSVVFCTRIEQPWVCSVFPGPF